MGLVPLAYISIHNSHKTQALRRFQNFWAQDQKAALKRGQIPLHLTKL